MNISDTQATTEALTRRADRERKARKAAEKLLVDKSREVYQAHENTKAARDLLEMAIWASGESIWDWRTGNNTSYYRFIDNKSKQTSESHIHLDKFLSNVHADDLSFFKAHIADLLAKRIHAIDCAVKLLWKNGHYRWQRLKGRPIEYDEQGKVVRVVGTMLDIESSVKTEESYKLMSYVFSQAHEPMMILSSHFDILEVNGAFARRLRARKSGFKGWPVSALLKFENDELRALLVKQQDYQESLLEYDDISIPVEVTLNEFSSVERGKSYIICMLKDLTERKLSQNQLHKLAHYDSLTELLNRNALQNAVSKKIQHLPKQCFAVLFIDLDGFKDVNDSMGHEAGDKLLKSISELLVSCTQDTSTIARWGGDEFVAVCDFTHAAEWQAQAKKILDAFTHSDLAIKEHGFNVSCSIGVSLYPDHGNTVDDIVRNADLAMYEAKLTGKNRWIEYHRSLTDDAIRRIELVNELGSALEHDQIAFHAQGKHDKTGRIVGAELLARWHSPNYGKIGPDEFIPLMEQHGLANKMGFAAIRAGAHFISQLQHQGHALRISVNISSTQIIQDDFLSEAKEICDAHNTLYDLLEFEVTESVFVDNPEHAKTQLKAIQQAGFKISLDDFGTGYSSLSYIREIDFDTVKVDRSFLRDSQSDEKAKHILSVIAFMCEGLNSLALIEGVETVQDLALLHSIGYENFQGFYFSRPQPLQDFIEQMEAGETLN
jgi:diguanylate cyclase (GGDEF)-like protein